MDASKITANVKYDLAISQIVLGKKMWLEKRGEYTYFLVTDDAEPWKRSRDWERLKQNYTPAKWDEYSSRHHILAGEKRYTLDISAAQEVIKETAKEPFVWHIESINLEGGKVQWWASLWGDMPDGSISEFSAQAETIPLAVSRVALLKGGGV